MMLRCLGAAAALITLLILGACASGPSESVPEDTSREYRLDTGDQVRVVVFGEDRLSDSYTVNGSGFIAMPLTAGIEARGLTTEELEAAIADELRKGIVVNPSVSVQIEQYRPFFILGQVQAPGQYPYVQEMTVVTAVAIAGGFTFRANETSMKITRTIDGESREFKAKRETKILPGDVIFVSERFF